MTHFNSAIRTRMKYLGHVQPFIYLLQTIQTREKMIFQTCLCVFIGYFVWAKIRQKGIDTFLERLQAAA